MVFLMELSSRLKLPYSNSQIMERHNTLLKKNSNDNLGSNRHLYMEIYS